MSSGITNASIVSHPVAVKRIECVERGWIKRAEPGTKNPRRMFWRCLTAVIPWPLLRSTATSGDNGSVCEEARRLREWKTAGLPVPELLESSPAHILTSDCGIPLQRWLKDESNAARRLDAVSLAAEELGRLHKKGFCHGRPFLKDILFDGRKVTFIDLEEDPTRVMSLETAQVRDVMLFVMSFTAALEKRHNSDELLYVARMYARENPSQAMRKSLRRNLCVLWWAALPLRLVPQKWFGRDMRQALAGMRVMRMISRQG